MRKVILTAALAIAASPVFALAPSGGEPNNTGCNGVGNPNSPCQPSNTNENSNEQTQTNWQGQGQSQGQAQGQGQIATGGTSESNSTGIGVGHGGSGGQGGSASATGGSGGSVGNVGSSSKANSASLSGVSESGNSASQSAATGGTVGDTSSSASNGDQSTAVDASSGSTSGASADGSGNSTTRVDASNNSRYNSQSLFQASIPAAAPTFAPGALATVVHGQCGPLMAIQSEEVTGTYLGLFRKHHIALGRTDRIVPHDGGEYVSRTYPDGSTRLFGHRAVRTTAVVTISGSRQVGAGGGQTGGGYGQLGVGGGSSMQRVVTQIDLEPCEAFHSVPAPAPVVVAAPEPAPVRRSVKRRPAMAMCVPKPAMPSTICPVK
jgi:hypothetical protein